MPSYFDKPKLRQHDLLQKPELLFPGRKFEQNRRLPLKDKQVSQKSSAIHRIAEHSKS